MKKQNRKTSAEFIEAARQVHGNKYVYDDILYVNTHIKVNIICPEHGIFEQQPVAHLRGAGCPSCYGNKRGNVESFIERAKTIHKNRYDYSKVKYESNDRKVNIVCHVHGSFFQTPRNHLVRRAGCPKCARRARLSTDEFVQKAKEIHGDKYDYSKVQYINSRTPIIIKCKQHGEWKVAPTAHISLQTGCPKCNYSKGESRIENFLIEHSIKFIPQYCPSSLKSQNKKAHYRFDFYLPEENVLIEFDGIQHQKPIKRWNTKYTSFEKIVHRDAIKSQYAIENHIRLIRIPYKNLNCVEQILLQMLSTNS